MAVEQRFNVAINLTKNELRNAILQVLASAPATPLPGQLYYDSTNAAAYVYNGTRWVPWDARLETQIPIAALAVNPLARANHTGTQSASTISDLNATVLAYRLDQFASPTAALDLNDQVLTNVGAPIAASDAASKGYVDNAAATAAAGLDPKDSALVATTASITLAGTQMIDGVALSVGERVLVKDQASASENGLYLVSSGAWARTTDAAQGNLTSGALVFIEQGETNAASQWYLQTADPVTVGATALTFVQFAAGAAYSAGAGLTLSGSQFNVGAGEGIVIDADTVALDPAVGVRKFAATIGDGTATSFTLTHNLNTKDISVVIRNTATDDIEYAALNAASANTVTIAFATAPDTGAYRAVVHG